MLSGAVPPYMVDGVHLDRHPDVTVLEAYLHHGEEREPEEGEALHPHEVGANSFAEHAQRLLGAILDSNDLEYSIWTLMDIYESQAVDPNVNRERLMEDWVA